MRQSLKSARETPGRLDSKPLAGATFGRENFKLKAQLSSSCQPECSEDLTRTDVSPLGGQLLRRRPGTRPRLLVGPAVGT
jgi:hypothetical protein